LCLLLGLPSFAAEGWTTYSEPFPVHSAIPYRDGLILATDGGIRVMLKFVDKAYASADGLGGARFYTVIKDGEDVYAVSEYGVIAKLVANGDAIVGWEVLNRSFFSNGVRTIPDACVIVGNIMVVPFENRIGFFDIEKKLSVLTIDHIANISLMAQSPKAVAVHEDTLFVSTGKSVYARKMNWSNLSGDIRLIDPASWTQIPVQKEVNSFALKGNTLEMYETEGFRSWDGGVETSAVQDSAAKILLKGRELTEPSLYHDGRTLVKWIYTNDVGTSYLISSQSVWKYENGKLNDISQMENYKLGAVYDLVKHPDGGVMAASLDGPLAYANNFGWAEPYNVWDLPISNANDAYAHRIKTLAVLPYGFVLTHIWGQGFFMSAKFGELMLPSVLAGQNDCLDQLFPNFTIAAGTTVAPDSSGFLTTTASYDGYSVIYMTVYGDVSCATHLGTAPMAGPIQARFDENGNWEVYVATRDQITTSTTGVLDVYTFTPPVKNGGRLESSSHKSFNIPNNNAAIDMVLDPKNEVLWMVSNSNLGYLELDQDSVYAPHSIKGLQNPEYSSIDIDVQGNVWLGTTNLGVYRARKEGKTYDTLSTLHFTVKDGLLDNSVTDLAVDPVLGMAWFAHDKGVSAYVRNDLRNASSFMTAQAKEDVKAYPNPFRMQQNAYMTIDNISEDATVSIFNRGGNLIKFFSGEDVMGGRVTWDGTGKNGWYVVPGVYYYVVKTSSKTKKGKIILIR
jgi:hypothetical protein